MQRRVAVRFISAKSDKTIQINHVIEHIRDPINQHKISIDNVALIKEICKPNQLEAYEGIYIM
jgi:hypothetical protein